MVVVVVVAGLVGWRQYDAAQRAAASAAYSAALAKIAQDPAAARAEFDKQAASAPEPYRSLAALIAAQLREPLDAQVTALVAVAPTLSSAELADLANVIAAFKSVDSPKAEEMVAKLEPLAAPDRPFRAERARAAGAGGGAQGRPQARPRAVDGDRQGSPGCRRAPSSAWRRCSPSTAPAEAK